MICHRCDQPLPVLEAVYVGSDPCHPACADAWWYAVDEAMRLRSGTDAVIVAGPDKRQAKGTP